MFFNISPIIYLLNYICFTFRMNKILKIKMFIHTFILIFIPVDDFKIYFNL